MTLLAVMQTNDSLSDESQDFGEMQGTVCVAGLRLVRTAMIKRCNFC